MPFKAYDLYKEYEPDKYKTSTQKKAEGVLKEAEALRQAQDKETKLDQDKEIVHPEIDVEKITSELEQLLGRGANKDDAARGLAGVETPESMELRERLIKEGASKNEIARGLAGVGTPESMELRERLLKEGANKNEIAWGLAGVGTPESMELRERLIKEGASKNEIAWGLAGVGTLESMELRERLLKAGADKDYVALGLAGVGTPEAYEFRNRHFSDPTIQARSFSTGWSVTDGVICRYGYEQ